MDLHALADFNLVAAAGGFGRASRAGGRPKATLSRRVAELETALGVRLIDRSTRAWRLTDEGRELHERTGGLLAEIAEAGDAVVAGAAVPRGRLRISAPVVFAQVALMPVAARFLRDHPQVRLEIVAEDRLVDPVEEGYDLVIRINPTSDEPLVGSRILGDRLLLVARPSMPMPKRTRASGAADAPRTVAAAMLASTAEDLVWTVRDRRGRSLRFAPEPLLRVSSLVLAREAALAGIGAALLPELLVADDLVHGRLVCWGVDERPPVEIWALRNARRLVGAKVRAFLDAIAATYPTRRFVPSSLASHRPRERARVPADAARSVTG